jgi:translation initiation factor 1
MHIIDLTQLENLILAPNPETPNTEQSSNNPEASAPPTPQKNLRVWREKQKGGRVATLIKGFENIAESDLTDLAKTLKTKLATGGAAKNNEITLQGDVRTKTIEILQTLGHRAKPAG